ncbi:MAG: Ig-like domain-containing protein, partial [Bacteroidaceae bacterium]|nr:Ig-like domain-containing protein [Bacteroidaceae bacterium]
MKKSRILFFVILMMGIGKLSAQTDRWIDVTSYLQNPGFDGNSRNGWTFDVNASSSDLNHECQEFWNGTFDFWQTVVNVPNGSYRLSVQGYYRIGGNSSSYTAHQNGTERLTAQLYANSAETALVSVYSEYLSSNYNNSCWAPSNSYSEYYPNQMVSAAYCFSQGMYNNQLEFEVTDSRIQLGVRNESYTSSNWAIFDNFKLEYFGTDTHASSISFPQKTLTLELGENYQLTPTFVPENTVYREVNWRSSNPAIVSVDERGNLTTHSKGTVTIIAISADNSSVSATCSVIVTQKDATSESLVINEIMAANVDMFMDPSWNYGGFVELYNPSTEDAAIGKFYVSDDPANLKKCVLPSTMGKIPAKGFRTLWFDHSDRHAPTQVNMKLDTDGGTIYISNCEGNIVAQQSYPPSMARISYARTT